MCRSPSRNKLKSGVTRLVSMKSLPLCVNVSASLLKTVRPYVGGGWFGWEWGRPLLDDGA